METGPPLVAAPSLLIKAEPEKTLLNQIVDVPPAGSSALNEAAPQSGELITERVAKLLSPAHSSAIQFVF